LFEREISQGKQAAVVWVIGKESKILWAGIVDNDIGPVFIYLFIIIFNNLLYKILFCC
jgi:hypothetical protein